MIKNVMKYFLSVVFFAYGLSAYSTEDPTMIQIKDNTKQTALHTAKGEIEYTSFAISILAFFVAGITLYYSIRTYRSQKKTERNTLRWTAKQERSNLRRLGWGLMYRYRKILAIEKALVHTLHYPLPENFISMKINVEDLHLNDFFGESINYEGLYELGQKVTIFNQMLDNRYNQARLIKIRSQIKRYVIEKHRFFIEERAAIKEMLLLIDELYPQIFDRDEKCKDDKMSYKIQLLTASSLPGQNYLRKPEDECSTYSGKFGWFTLEYCNSVQVSQVNK